MAETSSCVTGALESKRRAGPLKPAVFPVKSSWKPELLEAVVIRCILGPK